MNFHSPAQSSSIPVFEDAADIQLSSKNSVTATLREHPMPNSPEELEHDDAGLIESAQSVFDVEIKGLAAVQQNLDEGFSKAIRLLEKCKGRVVITGMGKSGIVGKKIAATLSSTGTPSLFLHPAEGSHGDLGVLTRDDVVVAISNSGETPEILGILPLIKRFGVPLISMTGKANSTLAKQGDCILNISVPQEACPLGLAPTASTTATLAMGDALAVVLLELRGFSEEDFALFHPAGSLGKRLLLQIKDIMHSGQSLPLTEQNTPFMDALVLMSEKKLGLAIVRDDKGQMLGVLTDGDVRRALTKHPDPRQIKLIDAMTVAPKTIGQDELAVKALRLMETHKITVLVVTTEEHIPIGVIHLHDLLNAGLA